MKASGQAGTDERGDVVGNVHVAGNRLERNVVIHDVVGENAARSSAD
jgi:hypothetical protein